MSGAERTAGALAQVLGDPADPDALLSRSDILALDESSAFPAEAVQELDKWGLPDFYVPSAYGGSLSDLVTPMRLIREVARRDLTVAVAHGKTFLGAVCAWLVGGGAATSMAGLVLGGEAVSWGLTERGRGSDLVRTQTRLRATTTGLELTGEKWPINNASRGRVMVTLARTSERLGPTALSLVVVDKLMLDPTSFEQLAKVPTHGIRGADISGVRWSDAHLPESALLGDPGAGLELVLKGLQLTRLACTALSIGAADRAMEEVLEFGRTRRMAGRALADLPIARAQIGGMLADALTAEATAVIGAEQASSHPHELGLVSAVVKSFVPSTVDRLFGEATQFLGARALLTDYRGAGLFQKALRDNRVVGIFDGNTIVSLHGVINEFPAISRGHRATPERQPRPAGDEIDFAALRLRTRHGSAVLRGLPEAAHQLAERHGSRLPVSVEHFCRAAAEVLDEVCEAPLAAAPSARSFDLARRVSEVFAGSCCIAVANGGSITPASAFAQDLTWLDASLRRILARIGRPVHDEVATSSVLSSLADLAVAGGKVPTLLMEGSHARQ